MKGPHLVDRGPLEILHRADHRLAVGRVLVRQRLEQDAGLAIGPIVDPHPVLLLHHLALANEVLLVHHQRAHPLGLQPQSQR
jgi:hypothetical protein